MPCEIVKIKMVKGALTNQWKMSKVWRNLAAVWTLMSNQEIGVQEKHWRPPKNLMSNNIYFVWYEMMECIRGIIITIFHITLLKLGQPERFHLSNFSWIQHLRIIAYWPRLTVLLHTSTGPNTNWTQINSSSIYSWCDDGMACLLIHISLIENF